MAYIALTIPLGSGASVLLPTGTLVSPRAINWDPDGIQPDIELIATPRAEFGSEQDPDFHSALKCISSF